MEQPFGDQATESFYRIGADPIIPAFLYKRARMRIDQLIGATMPQDMAFPVTSKLETVPKHPGLWRITLWPADDAPAEWYLVFRFDGPNAQDIRIVRANLFN